MKKFIVSFVLISILSSCSYQTIHHTIDTTPIVGANKATIIFYVNGLVLDGEVPLFIDGIEVGIADKRNYVKAPITYGSHIFNTKCNIASRISTVCVAKRIEIEINKEVTYLTYNAKNYPATFILSINETPPVSKFYGLEL